MISRTSDSDTIVPSVLAVGAFSRAGSLRVSKKGLAKQLRLTGGIGTLLVFIIITLQLKLDTPDAVVFSPCELATKA